MILSAAQGERREAPPRGMAHEYFAAGRRGHAASLRWLAPELENRKNAGNVFPRRNSMAEARREAQPMERIALFSTAIVRPPSRPQHPR